MPQETPEKLFAQSYERLAAELTPQGQLEIDFVNQIARYSVLIQQAQNSLIALDPSDQSTKSPYRRLSSLLNSYERAIRFAYQELRRIQIARVIPDPAAVDLKSLDKAPRLVRVAVFTDQNGLRKSPRTTHSAPRTARAA